MAHIAAGAAPFVTGWFRWSVGRYLGGLCIAVVVGCMYTPPDRVASGDQNTARPFAGYHIGSALPAEVQAWNATAAVPAYQTFYTSMSSTTATTIRDVALFDWSGTATIPSFAWVPSAAGASARVRARWPAPDGSTYDFLAVRPDWLACAMGVNPLDNFVTECTIPQTPITIVRTGDYVFGGAPGMAKLVSIRTEPDPHVMDKARETSVAATLPSGADPRGTVVVGYMDTGSTAGGFRVNSWSVTANHGVTWEIHNRRQTGFAWGAPQEAPMATGALYGSDPTVLATAKPGQVVWVSYSSINEAQDSVVIAVSNDGGRRWGVSTTPAAPVRLVTTAASSTGPITLNRGVGDLPHEFINGHIDRPVAVHDPVDNSIWVSWVQLLPETSDMSGLTARLYWVRGLRVDGVGGVQFLTDPIRVSFSAGSAACPFSRSPEFMGNPALAVSHVGGQRVLHLGYADRFESLSVCGDPSEVHWFLASGPIPDGATTLDTPNMKWSCEEVVDNSNPTPQWVLRDLLRPSCVAPGVPGLSPSTINSPLSEIPALAVNGDGDVVMAVIRSAYGMRPPRPNIPAGMPQAADSRVTLVRKRASTGLWSAPVQFAPPAGFHDQWYPTLAVLRQQGASLQSMLAVSWRDTRDDTSMTWGGNGMTDVWIAFSYDGGGTWPDMGRVTPLSTSVGAEVPWEPLGIVDYDGMAGNPVFGDFATAWTSASSGGVQRVHLGMVGP